MSRSSTRPRGRQRVIVTRTFSKVYGLAGLRGGYAVAAPKVIQRNANLRYEDTLNSIVAGPLWV